MDSIRSAEAAWTQAYEGYSAIKNKQWKFITGATITAVASFVAMLVGVVASVLLGVEKNAISVLVEGFGGLAFMALVAIFAVLIAFERPLAAAGKRANALREILIAAQKNFVEAHGIALPLGAFENLSFPILLPQSATILGTADVLLSERRELSTVLLEFIPEEGYTLSTTDGRKLKPLVLTAA